MRAQVPKKVYGSDGSPASSASGVVLRPLPSRSSDPPQADATRSGTVEATNPMWCRSWPTDAAGAREASCSRVRVRVRVRIKVRIKG